MNCLEYLVYITLLKLKKSSELWHTSVNRKARPVVEGEHDKSWNDHGSASVVWNSSIQILNFRLHIQTLATDQKWPISCILLFQLRNKWQIFNFQSDCSTSKISWIHLIFLFGSKISNLKNNFYYPQFMVKYSIFEAVYFLKLWPKNSRGDTLKKCFGKKSPLFVMSGWELSGCQCAKIYPNFKTLLSYWLTWQKMWFLNKTLL